MQERLLSDYNLIRRLALLRVQVNEEFIEAWNTTNKKANCNKIAIQHTDIYRGYCEKFGPKNPKKPISSSNIMSSGFSRYAMHVLLLVLLLLLSTCFAINCPMTFIQMIF